MHNFSFWKSAKISAFSNLQATGLNCFPFFVAFVCLSRNWHVSAWRDTFIRVRLSLGEWEMIQLLCPQSWKCHAMLTTEECVPFPPFSTKYERGDPISFSNLNIIHEIFSAIKRHWIARPLFIFKEWGFAQICKQHNIENCKVKRWCCIDAVELRCWRCSAFLSKMKGYLYFLSCINLHFQNHLLFYLCI